MMVKMRRRRGNRVAIMCPRRSVIGGIRRIGRNLKVKRLLMIRNGRRRRIGGKMLVVMMKVGKDWKSNCSRRSGDPRERVLEPPVVAEKHHDGELREKMPKKMLVVVVVNRKTPRQRPRKKMFEEKNPTEKERRQKSGKNDKKELPKSGSLSKSVMTKTTVHTTKKPKPSSQNGSRMTSLLKHSMRKPSRDFLLKRSNSFPITQLQVFIWKTKLLLTNTVSNTSKGSVIRDMQSKEKMELISLTKTLRWPRSRWILHGKEILLLVWELSGMMTILRTFGSMTRLLQEFPT
mmetsp:Transcript_17676/g.20047  ORF Transcript_17676/g.20047 Transcript_17676/m.20047 type:complete len:290 (-) Transcript_17676:1192-2061(-)